MRFPTYINMHLYSEDEIATQFGEGVRWNFQKHSYIPIPLRQQIPISKQKININLKTIYA
jgi:hypothetical protein